eukprot:TRINITY_DN21196_c0_g1_i1.p1 TRINITY_DN21196_c0_g1~~TRINITY_DN21196_c0_g1_i1.p1  ORF type:complete len:300 (+),score=69.21 TRINITY_DN21196_c0_g1_i1:57-956(+)
MALPGSAPPRSGVRFRVEAAPALSRGPRSLQGAGGGDGGGSDPKRRKLAEDEKKKPPVKWKMKAAAKPGGKASKPRSPKEKPRAAPAEAIDCVCGVGLAGTPYGARTITCNKCSREFHLQCLGMMLDAGAAANCEFYCPWCRPGEGWRYLDSWARENFFCLPRTAAGPSPGWPRAWLPQIQIGTPSVTVIAMPDQSLRCFKGAKSAAVETIRYDAVHDLLIFSLASSDEAVALSMTGVKVPKAEPRLECLARMAHLYAVPCYGLEDDRALEKQEKVQAVILREFAKGFEMKRRRAQAPP